MNRKCGSHKSICARLMLVIIKKEAKFRVWYTDLVGSIQNIEKWNWET
jgi:hypothetical protein